MLLRSDTCHGAEGKLKEQVKSSVPNNSQRLIFFLKAAELCSVKMFWVKNTLNCRKYLKNQEGVLVFY